MKKRLWATILTLCMVLGMLPGTARAADSDFIIENGVLTRYTGSGGDVTIPNSVTKIGDLVFRDCNTLTSVSIPNSVAFIGNMAFQGCTGLTSVTIPDSVTVLGGGAFDGCTGLTSITIPNSITIFLASVIANCSKLSNIQVNSDHPTYASIEGVLFSKDGTQLVAYPGGRQGAYVIPNSVTHIGANAFEGCGLTSITIPSSVTSIDGSAFSNSTSLTGVTIPSSVIHIGASAFLNCTGLTSIAIPNSIPSIENFTFKGCSNLVSVDIPNGVTSIGQETFSNCTNLTGVTIPDSVTSIGSFAFEGCSNLANMVISNNVTSIGHSVFAGCGNLTSITIPNSVKNIGYRAFYFCNRLTSVTIPDNVTHIDDQAFCFCDSLKDVYYTGSKNQWETIEIGNYNDPLTSATIHYNGAGEDNDRTATVFVKGGKYIDSNGDGDLATVSENGDTVYIPAGTTVLVLDFAISTNGVLFSDENVINGRPNPNCILFDGDCGLTATEASIYRDDGILFLALNGLAKSGSFDITIKGLVDADGRNFVGNKLHVVVQENEVPTQKSVRVDFFPNGGTITSIKGYTRDQIMQDDPSVPDDILFIDVNSGIAGMMTDKTGIISDFPVVEREGYTFDGWWYTEDSDVINNAYDREITDFANAQKVDHSTSFTKWAYGDWNVSGVVIAKWNKRNNGSSGDLTGDNKVTMADVLRLARGAAGYVTLTEQEQKAGDVTGDGKITMADVIRIARYAAGYSSTL